MLLMSASLFPAQRTFTWFPLAGQRHAIDQRDRTVPLGSPMRCLCEATLPRGPEGDMEWLWPTCPPCWEQTCIVVGLRSRPRAVPNKHQTPKRRT